MWYKIYIHTHTHTHTYAHRGKRNMKYYCLTIKKEQNNAICSNMDGPRDYHTKCSKPDRES